MYPNLKLEIYKKGMNQGYLARQVGIGEAVLSRIIRGYREPSAEQRRILSEFLGREESWLFEKFDVQPIGMQNGHPAGKDHVE